MKLIYQILFLAVFLGLVPLSCDNCVPIDSCDCQGPLPNYPDFEITSMGIRLLSISPQQPIDTAFYQDVQNLAIGISVKDKRDIAAHINQGNFLFQSMSYACSPTPGQSTQFIQNIEVRAANRVFYESSSDSIKTGDLITNRFDFAQYSPSYFDPLSEFLQEEPRLNNYGSFYFRLNSAPFQPTILIVDVEVTLSDGQVFKFENEILKVK